MAHFLLLWLMARFFLRICRMAYAEMPEWHILARRLMAKCHSGTCSIIENTFPKGVAMAKASHGKPQWQSCKFLLNLMAELTALI